MDCNNATHHTFDPVTPTSSQETEELNYITYAKYIRYPSPAPNFMSKVPPPIADINAQLYLGSKDPYDPSNPPFTYECFDKFKHIFPDVLWFQTYSKNPSAIN